MVSTPSCGATSAHSSKRRACPLCQRRRCVLTPNVRADCNADGWYFELRGIQVEEQDVAPVDGMVQNLQVAR